ncbi:M20/M25/M40 family metallo-hydrolase [Nocardiopsis mangrovi]|uniref:M20/M25/M40 family metallo-hydrolase n=1 Tax=Nocardiopsis mangrovi TaxID=1179818 RepID=A0ABV9E014_9ACTN
MNVPSRHPVPSPGRAPVARRLAAGGATAALVLGFGLAPGTAHADESVLPTLVTTDKIRAHMENLQTIADYNGGNRASATAGYDVAAKYVINQLERAGYTPVKHTYEYDSWAENSPAVLTQTAPEKREFTPADDFVTMSYSGAGDTTAPGVPVNADSAESGCAADDFAGFPEGAVAITLRGTCPFSEKTQNAADAGASGVVVINNEPGPLNGTVGTESAVPVVGVTPEVGAELLAAGEGLELRLAVDAAVTTRSSYNIIAESAGGAPDNTVVVGAHLDGVPEGAGINDNGSGTAAVLETARQFARLDTPNNQVRFAFWGTEEEGLVGSTRYVEGLSDDELEQIALYLNFDMIGSENFGRFVYDGRGELDGSLPPPAGSAAIQKLFEDYFTGQDLVSEPTEFSGRSDYSAFMEAGVPSGGLFSGADGIKTEEQVEYYGGVAGEPYDANYHTADDRVDEINWDAVEDLSDAIAHSVETYADSTLPVNGVASTQQAQEFEADRLGDRWLR